MGDLPFVFVSHSSRDDQLTQAVCGLLKPEENASASCYVLVDFTELRAGEEWPRYLLEWMARCHVAVVLLTARAIESAWVLKEVTILAARRSLDPTFQLLIVRFPDTDDLLKQHGYGPLLLDMIQQSTKTDPSAIVANVREMLSKLPPNTPYSSLVRSLGELLGHAGPETLRTVAGKLNAIQQRLILTQTEQERHVETIARHLVCGNLGMFRGIHELVGAMGNARRDIVEKVFEAVAPYWIAAEAAGRLPTLLHQNPRLAAALNGSYVDAFTAQLYVLRAHPLNPEYKLIPIAGGNHDKLVDHVASQICEYMQTSSPVLGKFTEKQIIAFLRAQPPTWYAVLPPPLPDPEALGEILELFPSITFIAWPGEKLSGQKFGDRVTQLLPEVELQREFTELGNFAKAQEILGRIPH